MSVALNHASVDRRSREEKARKIARLLKLDQLEREVYRVLEIGCGSGVISHCLAQMHPDLLEVWAVDVVDQRIEKSGYRFQLVAGVLLPFQDGSFDIVISNHVVEHVGGYEEQMGHLKEIKRLLASAGSAYLATPSRWMVLEPHFGILFLSWLPETLRSPYLKLRGVHVGYDCRPLSPAVMENMIRNVGFRYESLVIPALREIVEGDPRKYRFLNPVLTFPNFVLKLMTKFSPTLIYRLFG